MNRTIIYRANDRRLAQYCKSCTVWLLLLSAVFFFMAETRAEITLEQQVKITDLGLHFDGEKVTSSAQTSDTPTYDYFFGPNISAHGDSVKAYKNYVFMTWYRGGKFDRRVMLSRYNLNTGSLQTIEFPHQHTGFNNIWWIGESHNTIAVGISPVDESIHLLYDMHAYGNHRPADGSLSNDYFRYSFSVAGAATVVDSEFKLSQFVKDTSIVSEGVNDYKHLALTGDEDHSQYSGLTYPKFFTNTDGTLLMYMRKGGNDNGGYVFSRYDAGTKSWSEFNQFNVINAKNYGQPYNWGLYGNMKYVNGKLRVGFQRRSGNKEDKYQYQNGFYYAYSDHPEGASDWQTHDGQPMTFPLQNADDIKISEPGDLVSARGKDQVYIVHGFDWNVTAQGDVHFIGKVKDTAANQTVYMHTYKPAGAEEFITATDFAGADKLYTAGDNLYIIGLTSSGYPYVEKAAGGTNDFTRVFELKDGPSFHHGSVYIEAGKLYYYLMERGAGNALPLYLLIIDLDIDTDSSSQNDSDVATDGSNTDTSTQESSVKDGSGSGASIHFSLLMLLFCTVVMRRKINL
ncbi:BNR-4 repeat-containing protein [Thalassotalea litorea]|uniref:BNR-4 repeat-containing protein n=1 Tax=Thalassotalea litorea TaxID=2020715 RepID=UPI00373519F1